VFDQDKRTTPIRPSKSSCGVLIRLSVPSLDRGLQDRIGRDLRAMYAALLREPIPDRILDLVEHLGRTPRRSIQ
jgi:Anti-sigma factor NepR